MRNRKRAFTLTELLVVVIVIGVLAAVVLPKFNKVIETRKTTELETVFGNLTLLHLVVVGTDKVVAVGIVIISYMNVGAHVNIAVVIYKNNNIRGAFAPLIK